jgi:hypothetical protein
MRGNSFIMLQLSYPLSAKSPNGKLEDCVIPDLFRDLVVILQDPRTSPGDDILGLQCAKNMVI